MTALAIAFAVAAITGIVLQPLLRRFCQRHGHVDKPDQPRKRQPAPVPLSGGIAVAVAVLAGVAIAGWRVDSLAINREILVFAGGAVLALLMGIIDDRRPLCASQKLVVQCLAAGCACYAGIVIDQIALPFADRPLRLGVAAIPLTVLWFAACMNGFNFVDGCDGVAAGTACSIGVGALVITVLTRNYMVGAIAAALLGALVPFLWYNWPPARTYLGDAGAMFIGYLLAALALAAPFTGDGLPILVSLLLLAYPLYDVATTPIRRWRQNRPLGNAERGHPHFVLLAKGWSPARTAITITAINAALAALAALAILLNAS